MADVDKAEDDPEDPTHENGDDADQVNLRHRFHQRLTLWPALPPKVVREVHKRKGDGEAD